MDIKTFHKHQLEKLFTRSPKVHRVAAGTMQQTIKALTDYELSIARSGSISNAMAANGMRSNNVRVCSMAGLFGVKSRV
jgi:hypothetical protein